MIWNENRENAYCEITPAIMALKEQWEKENFIDPRLYREYNVKRGLRDEDGRGGAHRPDPGGGDPVLHRHR